MAFFRRIGKSIGTTLKDFGEELKEGFETIPQKFEQIGKQFEEGGKEGIGKIVQAEKEVEIGLQKTVEFIDKIKKPIQTASKVGEVVGGIILSVAPFIPPPVGTGLLATGGVIIAVSLGLDKGIDALNRVEIKAKQAQKLIADTKTVIEKGKELKEKHKDIKNIDILEVVKDAEKYAKDLKKLKKQIDNLKDLEEQSLSKRDLDKLEAEVEDKITKTELNKMSVKVLLEFAKDKEIFVPEKIIGKKIKKKQIVQIIFDGLRGDKFIEPTIEEQVNKMTAKQLKAFAKKNKIKLKPKLKKAEILEIILDSFNEELEVIKEQGEVLKPDAKQLEVIKLQKMRVKELKKLVKSLGVKSASLRKADLIDAIIEARADKVEEEFEEAVQEKADKLKKEEKRKAEQEIGNLF